MEAAALERPPRRHRRAAVLGAPLLALTAASLVGTACASALLARHALLVAALCPRSLFLVTAARQTPLPLFMLTGFVRLSAASPSHFALGRHWGMGLADRFHAGPFPFRSAARVTEWLFRRLGPLALLLSPTGKTAALAGASGISRARVAVGVTAGLCARLGVLYAVAHR